ncbi:ATP-dependent protease La domain-containing protein [Mucor mucedo]|uniref:ATP-dependent protease La domain-containing protein n=1 Tax=Mucor mucedo TaxID=29922 RepID=UPI00221EE494|nr:ATP-dependent protease La domain-containing protein [Mucor mucedo]KAI7871383.1 ATP-dependent protease La domain-containing protein [Mucor mucedo]
MKESHLFGPDLYLDDVTQKVIQNDFISQDTLNEAIYGEAATVFQCSIGNHLLEGPVTNHCGHTFCKLCLLQYKITHDSCNKCQKRLPSYQFIHNQPLNFLLNNLLSIFSNIRPYNNIEIARPNQISNVSISFLDLNHVTYQNIPIYLSDFAVLPSQKLRIPIYTQQNRTFFQNALIACKEYQCLCVGILSKDKSNKKGKFGTIVKITSIEQRANDMLVDVIGMDRFKVLSVNQETDDFLSADLEMQFENEQDLERVMSTQNHWTEKRHIIKLSNNVHDFISELAHSTPSTSFCSAVEGLLGPVWLDSVQGLHGPLPSGDHPVAMCWWAAVVLPVSNTDRYLLLETPALEERLTIILSWIHDLKSQWGNCRRTAVNSVAKVGK